MSSLCALLLAIETSKNTQSNTSDGKIKQQARNIFREKTERFNEFFVFPSSITHFEQRPLPVRRNTLNQFIFEHHTVIKFSQSLAFTSFGLFFRKLTKNFFIITLFIPYRVKWFKYLFFFNNLDENTALH